MTERSHPGVDRVARLMGELDELGVDLLLVAGAVDLRYISGFTGSHGLALIASTSAVARHPQRFLTDFRYRTQAAHEIPGLFEREIVAGELLEALGEMLAGTQGTLGFDENQLSVRAHRRLAESLPDGWRLQAATGLVERLRAVKDAGEIERIRAASRLAERALEEVLAQGIAGRTERDVAVELELRMRRLGAEAPSFPSIVAAGAHGALPHAQPRERAIARDTLVTIDWGAQLEGYCSDCTRTFATGAGISEQAHEVYALVLRAQQRGLGAVRAGPTGKEVDALAREVIEQGGYGEQFGHGLGHGVGMEIHEAPRLSRVAGEEPLRAGNVVTVEPGVYVPGVLGVRIEDLVVVRDDGCEVLTPLSKELTVVG